MANGTYEEKQMGVVYTSDWDMLSSTILANVVCYDRLYFLRKKPTPKMPVFENTTIAKLFEYLFLAIGLTTDDFTIDATLNYIIPYGWLPGKTVDDTLGELARAGMCTVFVDRRDKIVVTVPYKQKAVGRVLSASTGANAQIKSVSQRQASYKAYTGVALNYFIYRKEEDTQLTLLSNQKLEATINEFKNVEFMSSPVLKVDKIKIDHLDKDITYLSVGAQSMDMSINSNVEVEDVDIEVHGISLAGTQQTITFVGGDETDRAQIKRLEVSSVLMQSQSVAKQYGNMINQIVTDINAYLSASLRGDLTFDIGDVYIFDDEKHKISQLPVYFTRITLNYSGALSCEVDCTNYNSLAIHNYAYIKPGFMVKVLKTE